jgi:hypothetical protein
MAGNLIVGVGQALNPKPGVPSQVGDKIIRVDGEVSENHSLDQVMDLILGDIGSEVTLDVQNRFGEVFSISPKRGDIDWIPDAATHAPEHAFPRQVHHSDTPYMPDNAVNVTASALSAKGPGSGRPKSRPGLDDGQESASNNVSASSSRGPDSGSSVTIPRHVVTPRGCEPSTLHHKKPCPESLLKPYTLNPKNATLPPAPADPWHTMKSLRS